MDFQVEIAKYSLRGKILASREPVKFGESENICKFQNFDDFYKALKKNTQLNYYLNKVKNI